MNMNDIETTKQEYGDSAKEKMFRGMTAPADYKNCLHPLVNIDAENYMLRGIGKTTVHNPPSSESSVDGYEETTTDSIKEEMVEHTKVEHATVEHATVEHAIVKNATLEHANLKNASVKNATVEHVNVKNDTVEHANMKNATVEHTNVKNATVEHANVKHAIVEPATVENATMEHVSMDLPDLNEEEFYKSRSSTKPILRCARIVSFHHIICSCDLSCCCYCGTSCSTDCHGCYHNYCSRFSEKYRCERDPDALPPVTLNYEKPVAEWTCHNVIEWMAALNLYPYSDVFRCKDIKGSDLILLDRDKLMGMGIKDEFHQKSILNCIDELLNSNSDDSSIYVHLVSNKEAKASDNTQTARVDSIQATRTHKLRQHSFNFLETCEKCNKYLRGLLHQGFICQYCGIIAHRTCAATGLPPCTPRPPDESWRFYLQYKSYFGKGLCFQFVCTKNSPAPTLLMKFTSELENRARSDESLELYNMYSATPPADQINTLVRSIDNLTDLNSLNLSQFSPVAISGVIKKYLRELPDPLIPVQWYDKFLEAQRKKNDEECTAVIKQLVDELPEHHKSTLQFIMAHLCRICSMEFARGNKNPPTVLIQVMCHIFLRPPWDRIIYVVYNTQAHNRIVEILLLHCNWGESVPEFASAPAVPPRKVSGRMGRLTSDLPEKEKIIPLQDADWYWGNIKREDVNELLNDTADGTFLVRDASSKGGEYTLTLRKGGANKLIKICHRDGKYGFTEPYTFNSVVELINHFKTVSLSQYNASLDIKLMHPVSRSNQEEETAKSEHLDKLVEKLVLVNKTLFEKQKVSEGVSKEFKETSQDVQTKRHGLNALKELVKVFQEQTVIQEKFQNEAQPHEIKNLEINSELLRGRLALMKESCNQLESILQRKEAFSRTLERQLTSLKPEIHSLRRDRDKHVSWLQQRGLSTVKLNQIICRNSDETVGEMEIDIESLPHNNQDTWLVADSTREEAEQLLKDKEDGTFLIRKSTNLYKHVLVIVCNGNVNHCIINETEKGYGFSEPYNIYPSLKDLVLHYATNSLEIHNDLLNTVLKYPACAT